MNDMRELYEQMILDHNRNPHNFMLELEGEVRSAYGFNPICGDEFTVQLKVEDGIVTEASFDGAGCAISTASASLMTDAVKGKTVPEVRELFKRMHTLLTTGEKGETEFGKLRILERVREHPIRIKCATLAWHTMNAALENSQNTVCTE
ncbi:MAG: SUF system NifU family Fe-S cluster assembly protein [Pseudomonadota bacterium]|nr:SUF system NifU family Fe-S cluster assembly protein [Pseudomonadota bacterium]